MPTRRILNNKGLNDKDRLFLEQWDVSKFGIYVPPKDDKKGVFVWTGRYVCGETVLISAHETARVIDGNLSVGIASQELWEDAVKLGIPVEEAYADTATYHAPGGVKSAIFVLNLIAGLPDGRQLSLEPPQAMLVHQH